MVVSGYTVSYHTLTGVNFAVSRFQQCHSFIKTLKYGQLAFRRQFNNLKLSEKHSWSCENDMRALKMLKYLSSSLLFLVTKTISLL